MLRRQLHPDDPARDLAVEWLLTNGLGGYAMGTAPGVNTRRYHGLLIAATTPPLGRILALHSIVEQLILDGGAIDLSTQQFGSNCLFHPTGHTWLVESGYHGTRTFEWIFRIGHVDVIRRVHLEPGLNLARLEYTVRGATKPATLRLRPMTPLRDFHSLGHESAGAPRLEESHARSLVLAQDGVRMTINADCGTWRIDPQWWRQYAYAEDRARGQDWLEDVWSPGSLECSIPADQDFTCTITAHCSPPAELPANSSDADTSLAAFEAQRRDPPASAILGCAADQFIVARPSEGKSRSSVIAGYPWFADWGRDTLISVPGLLIWTGRHNEAYSCLKLFADHIRDGLVPNCFDERTGQPQYNTVDASLWFFRAVREFNFVIRGGAKRGLIGDLLPACRGIIDAYRKGTRFNIRMDEDGLIAAGDETTQLTWMDAKRDGVVFTPRHGKAVEINALWFHALWCMIEMSDDAAERRELDRIKRQATDAFRAKFWWPERGCLHDVLTPRGSDWVPDGKLRPNQIFAVSLHGDLLPQDQRRSIVNVARERLLTPFGLRTLDPADPAYRGRYEGNLFERDAAYHQGTVWPWLIGPYCEALMRVNEFSAEAKREARAILQPLLDAMNCSGGSGCLGQIAEVYDGKAPHRPSGCPAQAWSVAEVLRAVLLSETRIER